MSIFPRHVAPSGAPIRAIDLARWARHAVSRREAVEAVAESLGERFGIRHAFMTATGRAGLTVLLRALSRLGTPDRDEVVLPSYTCYSVAASVLKAGLRPRLVDISPATLDYASDALEAADWRRVLAIAATNLYGMPNDLPALGRMARRHGAFLIDDAAQAMGASVQGKWSGTCGDAGLFSFDKGKNVSAIDGGVVVTGSDEIAAAIRSELATMVPASTASSVVGLGKAVAYSIFLRPSLYWLPEQVPHLELGKTVFTTDFPLARPSPMLAALGATMLLRLDEFTAARIATASALVDGLRSVPAVRTLFPAEQAKPVYLRLPILLPDATTRRRAGDALRAAGIGASESYPASLADVPEVRERLRDAAPVASGGRQVAACLLTLPTHPFVNARDVAKVVATLRAVVDEAAAAVPRPTVTLPAS